MAYEIPLFTLGVLEANQDMSSETTVGDGATYGFQYTPVNVAAATGAGLIGPAAVVPVAASGDPAIGILQNNPQLGEAAAVMTAGVSKCLIASGSASVSIGAKLSAVPQGGVHPAGSGEYMIARALEAGVAGDIITVLIERNGKL